jgi:hypothetical protein
MLLGGAVWEVELALLAPLRIFGQTGTLLMDVSELTGQNGTRIVQEIDSRAKNITQFIVKPISDDSCEVTIRTDVMREQGWLTAAVDQMFTTILMKDWYRKELQQLSAYVAVADEPMICHILHIPLQSAGTNRKCLTRCHYGPAKGATLSQTQLLQVHAREKTTIL